MREPALTQGARWTGSGLPAARRIACAFAAAAAFAPAGADAQRAPTPRESGGRGTILHYEEAGRANIVYFEETRGASSSAAAANRPAREEASMKAPGAGSTSTTAVADAPARRAQPRRVVAAGDTRADR